MPWKPTTRARGERPYRGSIIADVYIDNIDKVLPARGGAGNEVGIQNAPAGGPQPQFNSIEFGPQPQTAARTP